MSSTCDMTPDPSFSTLDSSVWIMGHSPDHQTEWGLCSVGTLPLHFTLNQTCTDNMMRCCVVNYAVQLVFASSEVKCVPIETTQGAAVVFFTAHQGSLREIVVDPIVFNQVLVNEGSGYNNLTGVFTAPETGVYQFMFSVQLCRGGFNNQWLFLVNGKSKSFCHAQISDGDTVLNTCYYVESLRWGDRVWIKQNAGSCAWASSWSKTITFSGVLLTTRGQMSSTCPLLGQDIYRTSMSSSVGRLHLSVVLLILCLLLPS